VRWVRDLACVVLLADVNKGVCGILAQDAKGKPRLIPSAQPAYFFKWLKESKVSAIQI